MGLFQEARLPGVFAGDVLEGQHRRGVRHGAGQDQKALEEQSMALENSVFVVNKHIGLIPDDYKNDIDVMGAIINYVFQGVNNTGNKEIENIGNQILFNTGRYDESKKEFYPFIKQ